jgi:hypothetical protein
MTFLIDTPALAATPTGAAICADCLTNRLGATRRQAQDIFARLAPGLTITSKIGRCDSCLKRAAVRRIG